MVLVLAAQATGVTGTATAFEAAEALVVGDKILEGGWDMAASSEPGTVARVAVVTAVAAVRAVRAAVVEPPSCI